MQVSTSAIKANEGKRQMYIRKDILDLSEELASKRKDILVWTREQGGGALCGTMIGHPSAIVAAYAFAKVMIVHRSIICCQRGGRDNAFACSGLGYGLHTLLPERYAEFLVCRKNGKMARRSNSHLSHESWKSRDSEFSIPSRAGGGLLCLLVYSLISGVFADRKYGSGLSL